MVFDLPATAFPRVQKRIPGADLLAVLEFELVDADVHGVIGLGLDCSENRMTNREERVLM